MEGVARTLGIRDRQKDDTGEEELSTQFNSRLSPNNFAKREIGCVFVRTEYLDSKARKPNLSPVADGPYKIIAVGTVELRIKDQLGRVLCDRVVQAPPPREELS